MKENYSGIKAMFSSKSFLKASFLFISSFALAFSAWKWTHSMDSFFMAGGISGTVYRDFDGDGIKDAGEPLVPGVTVTAYDGIGGSWTTTTTSGAAPNYTLVGFMGQVRVEFTINSTTECLNPNLDFSSTNGGIYGSSVQFVNASAMPTNINFALNNPADYNKGASATNVYVPCYTSGNPLVPGSQAANGTWFVGFPYNNSGNGTSPAQKLTGDTIGSTWGVAYSKQAKKIFTSAFLKRHVGLGKLGTGGIYILNPTATSFVATSFYNMDANGHRTRAAGTPSYASGFTVTGTPGNKITYNGAPDPLTGKPIGLGVVGTNAERGLLGTFTASYDAAAFGQVGKVGLGDLEISDDGRFLYVTNLYTSRLFRLQLNNAYDPTGVVAVDSFSMPISPCTNGVLRPYATKFYRNKLYVGAVCSAENNGSTAQLTAYVFELINPTAGASFSVTPVITFPLNYPKGYTMTWTTPDFGNGWNPWTDSLQTVGIGKDRTLPAPILSDLEFTDRGDLLLSFSDRTANQYGWGNYRWLSGNPTELINIVSGGDILASGLNCITGAYTLESAGMYTSDGLPFNNTGVNNNEGPGGDEFFNQENYPGAHLETHLGAVAVLKGDSVVITTVMDPTAIREGGTIKYNFYNGKKSYPYRLFVSANDITTGTFGKANGLGDIEVSGVEPPLEIGNRVWLDADADGVQDPGELPIANVTVEIYDLGILIGTDVTDANGYYYFDTTNIADGNKTLMLNQKGIQPNRTYTIIIGNLDWNAGAGVAQLLGYELTTTNFAGGPANPDLRDNDASLLATIPTITYTTGNWGENNHTLDFGFKLSPPPAIDTVDLALRKTIVDTLHNSANLGLNNGDTVKFKIELFNQGQVAMDSLNVIDYLPAGFKFVNATGSCQPNEGWDGSNLQKPVYNWEAKIKPVQALPLAPEIGNGVNTLSITGHNPGCGKNRLLLVAIAVGNNGTMGIPPTITSVTFQNNPIDSVGTQISPGPSDGSGTANARIYIYKLVNPTGIGNIDITLSGVGDIVAQAVTFTGVDQDNPIGTFQSFSGTVDPATFNFTSAAGELLYTIFGQDEGDAVSLPGGSDQTEVFYGQANNVTGFNVTEPGATSVTSSFDLTSTQDWAMGAISIKPAYFRPNDTIDICIYATLNHVPGSPTASDFTNYSEISYARDTNGVNQSANDIDGPLDTIQTNNGGGQPGSPADDYLNGNGTGPVGGSVAATDQDNSDPAVLNIFDLALKKTIDTGSIITGIPIVGDTIQFNITITNQGTITATDIEVTDTIPCGFLPFDPTLNILWSNTSPLTTYTIPGPLPPGQSIIVPIQLIFNNSCSDHINYAQISSAKDSSTSTTQTGDVDGSYDQNFSNDAGGKVNTNSDDVITGDGTGVPLDEIGATDEDDQDPAELLVFDLALKKVISSLTPGPYAVGSLIQFDITIYNQGNLPAVNINVVDTIPAGLSYTASDNIGLNWVPGNEANEYQRKVDLNVDTLKGTEDTTISIFLRVVHNSGGVPAFTNISEIDSAVTIISGMRDTFLQDADSPYDSKFNNDAGGQVSSPADNTITGNGTGAIGDGVSATDEDDQDPALVPIVDVALSKVISDTLHDNTNFNILDYGDTVKFDITVTNQGTVALDSVEVTDYIPSGFSLVLTSGWNIDPQGAVRVIHSRLDPTEDTVICIYLILTQEIDASKLDSAWINNAEISRAHDTLGNNVSLFDFDSKLNSVSNDNGGGQPGSPADNYILGTGTSAPFADGVAATDQDNHDPALVNVIDLALRKIVADTLGDAIVQYGDTIKFDIQIFNQGNIIIDSLVITDYIPDGFAFLPGFNPGWSGAAPTVTYPWGTSDDLLPGESDTISIYLQLIPVGEPSLADYTNYAEISFASDTAGVDQSGVDADSPLNGIDNDNPGGQPLSPADDAVNGNGTGTIGDGVSGTDQDNHDPASMFPRIVDLALIKVNQSSGPFEYGDTVALMITVYNQGTITMDSVEVTDSLPSGFFFDASLNTDWTPTTGSKLVSVITTPIGPGGFATLPLYLVILPESDPSKVDSAWTNLAEVSKGYEGAVDVSAEDMDSPLDTVLSNNAGGLPGSPADDFVNGDGTGNIGDGVDSTDQDNADPVLVELADLALRKIIADTLGNTILNYGDTIKYAIQIFNQGNVPVDSINVVDTIYPGLSFVVGALNAGWVLAGSEATYVWGAGDTLYPGESDTICIYVRILPGPSEIYTNLAEINSFYGVTRDSLIDADSRPDGNQTNDGGGNPDTPSDDAIDGNGKGNPGDILPGTDEDDEDPASFNLTRYSLGNLIWSDANNNGILDPGEPSLSNVLVYLHYYNPETMLCELLDSTLTDINGGYLFDTLIAGTYLIEIPQSNFAPGGVLEGYASSTGINGNSSGPYEDGPVLNDVDTVDSDDNGTLLGIGGVWSDSIQLFGLEPVTDTAGKKDNSGALNENSNLAIDFGFYPLHSVGNLVWLDADNDGKKDATEVGIQNVLVILHFYNPVSGLCDIIDSVYTDPAGGYLFDSLIAGKYLIEIAAINFAPGGPLEKYATSSGAGAIDPNNGPNETAPDPDDDADGDDNGTLNGNVMFPGAVFSDTLDLNGNEPVSPNDTAGLDDNSGALDINSNLTVDFGFFQLHSLGNQIFEDANNDGKMNPGETPLAGVKVILHYYNPDSLKCFIIDSTVSDAAGKYVFDSLISGQYIVEIAKSNFDPGGPLSAYASSTGGGSDIHSGPNEVPGAPIDGDTPADSTDHGVAGTGMFLGSVIGDTVNLGENEPIGEPDDTTALDPLSNLHMDFGFYPLHSLGNLVWEDANNNGILDPGEKALDSVKIILHYFNPVTLVCETVDSLITDANGGYLFDSLIAGTYLIEITQSNFAPGGALTGYASSSGVNGSATGPYEDGLITGDVDNINSDDNGNALPTGGVWSDSIKLAGNEPISPVDSAGLKDNSGARDSMSNLTIDFGFYPLHSIGNLVWADADNDGQKDITEAGIQNVLVILHFYNPSSGLCEVIDSFYTDPAGGYLFDSLIAGKYLIEIAAINFAPGGPLEKFATSSGSGALNPGSGPYEAAPDPDNDVDNDDNGTLNGNVMFPGSVFSDTLDLNGNEPISPNDSAGLDDTSGAADASSNLTVDFGFVPLHSIGNQLFVDSDNSGKMDPGEPVIPGVKVILHYVDTAGGGSVCVTIDSVITDVNGKYVFDSLIAGKYLVEIAASNFDPGGPLENYISSTGGGVSNTTGGPNEIPGAPIDADTPADSTDHGVYVPISAPMFGGSIISDTLNLGEDEPIGEPDDTTALDINSNLTIDFGFLEIFSIGNQVFADRNNDGLFDTLKEVPLPGVILELHAVLPDPQGGFMCVLIAYDTTDANGLYLFDSLLAGQYIVAISASNFGPGGALASGYTSSTGSGNPVNPGPYEVPDAPITDQSTDNDDNGALSTTGVLAWLIVSDTIDLGDVAEPLAENPYNDSTVTDDHNNLTIDFGFVPLHSIGNQVWADVNNNGIFDPGELPLTNVEVVLHFVLPSGGCIALDTVYTDSDGKYLFGYLTEGDYIVEITATNFLPGGPLEGYSSSTAGPDLTAGPYENSGVDGNSDIDNTDHGVKNLNPTFPLGSVASDTITIISDTEPQFEIDPATGMTDTVYDMTGATSINSNLTIDFGFVPLHSLGNQVFLDLLNDGLFTSGTDIPVAGVKVVLHYVDTTGGVITCIPIDTVYTDANGLYLFDSLRAGKYLVEITPDNFAIGAPLEGFLSSTGSGGDILNGPYETGSTPGGNTDIDGDDNGVTNRYPGFFPLGSVLTDTIDLDDNAEPLAATETSVPSNDNSGAFDYNSNLTIDFGFLVPCGEMTCIGEVNISLDENCEHCLSAKDVLKGKYVLPDAFYTIEILDAGGHTLPTNCIGREYLGYTLIYKITSKFPCDVNSCWGKLIVEDKFPPAIDCIADTILCFELLQIPTEITINDNCSGPVKVNIVSEQYTDYGCDSVDLQGVVRRRLVAVDVWGNARQCEKSYYIRKVQLSEVICPEDVTYNCTSSPIAVPSPLTTGVPRIGNVNLWPNNPSCKLTINYSDEQLSLCSGGYKIARTWVISDWCTGRDTICKQYIVVEDKTAPIASDKVLPTVISDPHDCGARIQLDTLAVTDCGKVVQTYQYSFVDPASGITRITNGKLPASVWIGNGTTEIKVNLIDPCANLSTHTITVTILDNTPPTPVCHEFTQVTVDPVSCWATIEAKDLDNGSHDNCATQLHYAAALMSEIEKARKDFADSIVAACGNKAYWDNKAWYDAYIEEWINCYVFRDVIELGDCGTNQIVMRVYEADSLPRLDPHIWKCGEHRWFCYNSYPEYQIAHNYQFFTENGSDNCDFKPTWLCKSAWGEWINKNLYLLGSKFDRFALYANPLVLNGNATVLGSNEYRLTSNSASQAGSAFFGSKFDLKKPIRIEFDVYGGTTDNGADGLSFILQNQGVHALGQGGGHFAANGINKGLALEFDTHNNGSSFGDISSDHVNFFDTDSSLSSIFPISSVKSLPNLEDGLYRRVIIEYNPHGQKLCYKIGNVSDCIENIGRYFGGSTSFYAGFGAGTGGLYNEQKVRVISVSSVFPEHLYNDCMVNVLVDDKQPPVVEHLYDITVFCDGAPYGTGHAEYYCEHSEDNYPGPISYKGIVHGYYGGSYYVENHTAPDEHVTYTGCPNGDNWSPIYCKDWLLLDSFDRGGKINPKDYFDKLVLFDRNHQVRALLKNEFSITDNCKLDSATLQVSDLGNLNGCGEGWMQRTWTIKDKCGNPVTAIQKIIVKHRSDFEVIFPKDTIVDCAVDEGTDTSYTGIPEISDDECEQIGVQYEDEISSVTEGACYKIVRTWTLIDWCIFDPNAHSENPDVIVDDRLRANDSDRVCIFRNLKDNGDGYMKYIQIIKVKDHEAPILSCKDTSICLVTGCSANVDIPLIGIDNCADKILYRLDITRPDGSTEMRIDVKSITGTFAAGIYTIKITARDHCGNESTCTMHMNINDCKKPTPYCLNGIATVVMPSTGSIQVWAKDLDRASEDNCTTNDKLRFSFSNNPANTSRILSCTDILNGREQPIPLDIWVTDESGNSDFCKTYILLQDNGGQQGGVCKDTTLALTSITGRLYTEGKEGVEHADVEMKGQGSVGIPSFKTTSDGSYSFSSIPMASGQSIQAMRDDNPMNGVSTLDLVLIQKHVLGTEKLNSPYRMIAADVNASNDISVLDLVELRKLILGLYDKLPNNTSWRFVPKSYNFSNAESPWGYPSEDNLEDIGSSNGSMVRDFIGVKIGDVNSSALAHSLMGTEIRSGETGLVLEVEDRAFRQGEQIKVDFRSPNYRGISGWQGTLKLEDRRLKLEGISDAGKLKMSEQNIGRRWEQDGLVTMSWNTNQSIDITEKEILFTMMFAAQEDGRLSEVLRIGSQHTMAESYEGKGELGNLTIRFVNNKGQEVTGKSALYQNYPNPFDQRTVIGVNLAQNVKGTLKITDITGRIVKVIEKDWTRGYHEVWLDRKEIRASGVLYYSFESKTFRAARKMVIVD